MPGLLDIDPAPAAPIWSQIEEGVRHLLRPEHRALPQDLRERVLGVLAGVARDREQGLDPACVSSCPTHCMHFGSLDDPGSIVSKLLKTRNHKVLHPGTGNEPNVYYLI